MQVEFLAKFNRDLDRIHLKSVKNSIAKTINEVKSSTSITQISNLKKLKGFRSAYRIRLGEYPIGIFHVEFARILHRKEIYRYFP